MLYFAYGSNMDWGQMRKRCPSASFVCVAKLKDHRLAFTRCSPTRKCGVADAIPAVGQCVWGVVYEIADTEIAKLDQCENYQAGRKREENSYVREKREVYRNGDENYPVAVQVYFAIPQPNRPRPSREYLQLIVGGAKFWRLP